MSTSSVQTRKEKLISNLRSLMTAQRMSQSELARRMVDRGWDHYSQMTVRRSLFDQRTVGAIEYEDLLSCLGAGAQSSEPLVELAELRAFKARITEAFNEKRDE